MLSIIGRGDIIKYYASILDCIGRLKIRAVVIYCKGGLK